ncbi:MAG: alpha/beta fold hydrolase [Myxococcota bacterium]|nr:alpha/beta fold hydrolase [Myxococcota bacterium]
MTDPWARTRTLDVIGVETPIFEAGPEGAPPIVLLHGNPDTHAVWNGVVSRLAATHRCIAPDMPDFGASVAPPDFDVSLRGQSRFVNALFDALELPRANLVCHDVGATYGLAFASEHADRLSSLTILNANFFPDYRWHFWARMWRLPLVGELVMFAGNEPLFVNETKKGSPGITDELARTAYRALHPRARRRSSASTAGSTPRSSPAGTRSWSPRRRTRRSRCSGATAIRTCPTARSPSASASTPCTSRRPATGR